MTHTATSTQTRRDTDHNRMAPQKRVLEEQFSIQFPTKRQNSAASSNPIFVHSQEKDDFRLALQLQQAEMESTTENESSSTAVEVRVQHLTKNTYRWKQKRRQRYYTCRNERAKSKIV